MKKIFRSLAALAVVMFAGCVNDLTNEVVEPSGKTIVTVGIADTKTSLGDLVEGTRKVYWSEGDQICINGAESSSVVLSEDKRSATFTFDNPELTHPYSVLYPAEMFKDAQIITLPAVQAAADNSFGADAAPMATYQAEPGNIMLQHLAGVVRLQVKLPAESAHGLHSLSRVELKGSAGEQVSGDFSIDYQTGILTSVSDAEADKVVVARANKTLASESSQDVFIVVPARTYEQGFKVRLIDAAGHYMDLSSKTITIDKGEIKAMPPVEFVPAGTLVDVEIATAQQLVTFANEYNAGQYKSAPMVKITADIEFDEETNTEWKPIGVIDNYFNGYVDGGNHSIKNWNSSRPLFAYTGSEGYVENLTIDSSCNLTADYTDANAYFGGFVGYHKGLLYNCHNNADVTATGAWTDEACVGGLAGRVTVGTIKGCSMTGNVIAGAGFTAAEHINLGGLVGRISNTDGSVIEADFTGDLTFAGGVSVENKEAYVGGIAGRSSGTVSGCSTASGKNISGEHATNGVYKFYWGGVVGLAEHGSIVECDNNSVVKLKYHETNMSMRDAYIGGIVGAVNAKVSLEDCDNAGEVESSSDCQHIYIGGVAGQAVSGSVIDNCHNKANADVTAKSSGNGNYGAKYLRIGGVVGSCETSEISNVSNAGQVEMNCLRANKGANANVGGCFGFLTASLDGINEINNSGFVTATDASETRSYLALGGVVGCMYNAKATLSLSNVLNTGNVTDAVTVKHTNAFTGGVVGYVRTSSIVTNVTNGAVNTDTGNVTFTNSETQTHTNTSLGGIVGAVDAGCVAAVKNSDNYGKISRVATSADINGSSMICGGIVGILKGAGSSVEECDNHGSIENKGLNTTKYDSDFDTAGQAAGGIVGFALGTTDGAVQIKSCTNDADCYTARAYVGGIAGYIRYATIDHCNNENNLISGEADYARVGGITGCMGDKSTVEYCDVTNAIIDGMAKGNTGGITGAASDATEVTELIQYSNVDATIYNSKGTGRGGSIVGLSRAGLTIDNCKVKGKVGTGTTATELTAENLQIDCYQKATITNCTLWE